MTNLYITKNASEEGLRRLAAAVLIRAVGDAKQRRDVKRCIDARAFLNKANPLFVLYAESAGLDVVRVDVKKAIKNDPPRKGGRKPKKGVTMSPVTPTYDDILNKHAEAAAAEWEQVQKQTEAQRQRQGQIDALTATLNVYAAEMQKQNQHPSQYTAKERKEAQAQFDRVYQALRDLGAVPPDRGNNSPRVKDDPIVLERR